MQEKKHHQQKKSNLENSSIAKNESTSKSENKEINFKSNKETEIVNSHPKPQNKNNKHQNNTQSNKISKYDYDFDGIINTEGVLEVMPDGYGFMRSSDFHYLSSPDDVYVSHSQIKLFGLVTGDTIIGKVRPPKTGEKYFPLIEVESINGCDPGIVRDRIPFHHLTPLFPNEKFNLLGNGHNNIYQHVC